MGLCITFYLSDLKEWLPSRTLARIGLDIFSEPRAGNILPLLRLLLWGLPLRAPGCGLIFFQKAP